MKSICFSLLLLLTAPLFAQTSDEVVDYKKHKIVMQFSDSDSVSQATVVGQVKNIRTAWPHADIEVVCHGPGLDLLMSAHSKVAGQVAEWNSRGVVFAACNNTMKRRKIRKEDLLPTAQVVPSAIIEIATRQEKGWAYVKGGH
jgi:uncharacterized protein